MLSQNFEVGVLLPTNSGINQWYSYKLDVYANLFICFIYYTNTVREIACLSMYPSRIRDTNNKIQISHIKQNKKVNKLDFHTLRMSSLFTLLLRWH